MRLTMWNTSESPSSKVENKVTRNSLLREGILPSDTNYFGPSNRARANSYKTTEHFRQYDQLQERKVIHRSRKSSFVKFAQWDENFLDKSEWLTLGDGWFQTTPVTSGSSSKFGLHSMIESQGVKLYMAVYEPRTTEGLSACMNKCPNYNLEVNAKIVQLQISPGPSRITNSTFQIVFAFKSINDYCLLTCDQGEKKWVLSRVHYGEEFILSETIDLNIRANLFYSVLIQVRGMALSVDVNSIGLFTAIRFTEIGLDGLVGVQAQGTKFAVKGWKLSQTEIKSSIAFKYSNSDHENSAIFKSKSLNSISSVNHVLPTPPHTPIAPKSLAELMKERLSTPTQNTSSISSPTSHAFEGYTRISSEPLQNWGESGGPGKPQTSNQIAKHDSKLPQHMSSLAPPVRIARRGSVSGVSSPGPLGNLKAIQSSFTESLHSTADSVKLVPPTNDTTTTNFQTKLIESSILLNEKHDSSIVDAVFRDVIQQDLGVSFDDIAALEVAKRLLNEAVILPLMMPEFFTGIREPWKGVLLFGPPGTGKTLLAKAVCGFSGSTFFNCSSSSLISKYRGDSEKIVRCLFEAARICAPSIVFLDEVDALVSSRGGAGEHEASRRMKTEIFSQMDGIASHRNPTSTNGSDIVSLPGAGVMVLATTNCPWDLDEALRRRLEKRLMIPLPDHFSRQEIFRIFLKDISISSDVTPHSLADLTSGYSGADIHIVCREAAMMPLRRLMTELPTHEIQKLRQFGKLVVGSVDMNDFALAISTTRPSVSSTSMSKYLEWEKLYGSK